MYDELVIAVTETEMILNSQSFVSSEDLDEPSHLLTGCRLLCLPEPPPDVDPDY